MLLFWHADGNYSPGSYIFDLGLAGWDGIAIITLADFWPDNGSISHASIMGRLTLSLLGAGPLLAGLRTARSSSTSSEDAALGRALLKQTRTAALAAVRRFADSVPAVRPTPFGSTGCSLPRQQVSH